MDLTLKDLCYLAKEHQDKKNTYEKYARNFLAKGAVNCTPTPEEFWAFVDTMRENMSRHKWDSKAAIDETVRSYLFDHRTRACCCECHREASEAEAAKQPSELDKWQKLAGFLRMYEANVTSIGRKIRTMPGLERGDDGFGDLCDSLPLAGKHIVGKIILGTIKTYKDLIDEMPGTGHMKGELTKTSKFIIEGENYIAMYFAEALTHYLATLSS